MSCRSNSEADRDAVPVEDHYLGRPKFIVESPISRLPYTLRWEENRMVRSYEVQMAHDLKFTDSRQNWTTKEPFLLLSDFRNDTVYIRIRSHFGEDISRWSEILEMKLQDDELRINRIRN